jgi:hypothetical protein
VPTCGRIAATSQVAVNRVQTGCCASRTHQLGSIWQGNFRPAVAAQADPWPMSACLLCALPADSDLLGARCYSTTKLTSGMCGCRTAGPVSQGAHMIISTVSVAGLAHQQQQQQKVSGYCWLTRQHARHPSSSSSSSSSRGGSSSSWVRLKP